MKNIERFPLVQKALSEKLGTTNDINDVPLIDEYKLSIKSMDDKRNPNAINIVATIKNNAGDIISMENDRKKQRKNLSHSGKQLLAFRRR